MRNLRLFLLAVLLLIGANSIAAQGKWVTEDSEWYYTFISVFETTQWYMQIHNGRDTIVKNTSCKVTDVDYPEILLYSSDYEDHIITKELGDSLFYYVRNDFYLLYDFSLEVGDTFRFNVPISVFSNNDSIAYLKVDSISSIELGENSYRAQYLSAIDQGATDYAVSFAGWRIEGIGSLRSFFPFPSVFCDKYCPVSLRCYSDKNIDYKRVEFSCDEVIIDSNTEDLMEVSANVEVFPNPLKIGEELTIRVKGVPLGTKQEINIYNSNGKIVKSGMNSGTSTIVIDESFTHGMYYIQLFSDSKTSTVRFVVN